MIIVLGGIRDSASYRDVSSSKTACLDETSVAVGTRSCDLAGRFMHAAIRSKDQLAVLMPNRQVSYATLLHAAHRIRARLEQLPDFARGSRVLLLLPNSPEYLAAFYGTLLAGGVVVPVSERTSAARLAWICEHCQARIMISVPSSLRSCRQAVEEEISTLDLSEPEFLQSSLNPVLSSDSSKLAAILYTSGSTGVPKGVMLSHQNLMSNADAILTYLPIEPHDRALTLIPFCHAYGNSIVQTHILSGATLVVAGSTVFPNSIVDALHEYQATSFAGVPELYRLLLTRSDLGRSPLPSLRYMTVAGGALGSEPTLELMQRISPASLFKMYGQTEATARLSFLSPEQMECRTDAIGKSIPGVELQVQDESGAAVSPGVTGELCARGPNVMMGYWRDEKATSQALRSGWLCTGDMARSDDDGFLYVVGRKRALIKIQGINVSLEEIARLLDEALPDCSICVVPFNDLEQTRIALFAVSKFGDPPSVEGLGRVCRELLPRHEIPHCIEVLDAFPLTDSLKIDSHSLASRAASYARARRAVELRAALLAS